MIDALVAGKLYKQPVERKGKAGRPFVTAKVRVAVGDGDALFVNVIAFTPSACAALLALEDGDTVALAGALTPGVWTDDAGAARVAVDMVAHGVLTPYHVTRKRRALGAARRPAPAGECEDGELLGPNGGEPGEAW